MSCKFSAEEDEKLVEQISKSRVLYDASEREYKNYIVKENVWKEISDTLKKPIADCKKCWRNIRDTYSKIKRGQKFGTGSAAKPKSKWPLMGQMSFLDHVSSERTTQSSYTLLTPPEAALIIPESASTTPESGSTTPEAYEYCTDELAEMPLTRPTKRRRVDSHLIDFMEKRAVQRDELLKTINLCTAAASDPLATFFKTMEATVRKMTDKMICEAKTKIFAIVSELELRALEELRVTENS